MTVQCTKCGELGTTIGFDTAVSLAAAAVKLAENETSADPWRCECETSATGSTAKGPTDE